MAYRRPAIEVIQEFQDAAVSLSLPSLPACVVEAQPQQVQHGGAAKCFI